MIELRVHHLFDFTKAVISENYRREYLGALYSEEQSEKIRIILQSITDATEVKIVTGIDDICRTCPNAEPIPDENCVFPDSIWDAKKIMYKVQPNEVITIGNLRKQYLLYQKMRNRPNWKKIVRESRISSSCGINCNSLTLTSNVSPEYPDPQGHD